MKNVKTVDQFNNISESWHKRLHWLREYGLNENNPKEKQDRACWLWLQMCFKLSQIVQISVLMKQPKLPDYPIGGYEGKINYK